MLTIERRRCSDGSFISAFGSASRRRRGVRGYPEITSLLRLWLSYTAISICVGSSAKGHEITPRSWLIFAVVPEKGLRAGERGGEARQPAGAAAEERRGREDLPRRRIRPWG